MIGNGLKRMLKRCVAVVLLLQAVTIASAADSPKHEQLDSVINMLNSMPNDSTRLRQCFISIQENIDQYWALDLIEYAQEQADMQGHLIWAMAFRGSKVRWTHHFHDWKSMDIFLKAQREKAEELNIYGNYISQIGQSAIVMAQMGYFEKSWQYIQQMEKDIKLFDEEHYDIYNYLVKADYYKYSGQESKRLALLLEAFEKNVHTNPLQRISLHVELIDVFGDLGEYDKALAHADSVLCVYDGYSPERKALPQSRGNISDANLRKVEIYQKLGNLPMMKKSLEVAEEYANTTDPKNIGDVHYWWAKYYLGAKDYERSLEHMNKAVSIYREYTSEEMAIHSELENAKVFIAMGHEEEALELYTTRMLALDSVRSVMISKQQDYLDELGNILSHKERSERMLAWQSYLLVGIAVILIIIVVAFLIYVIYIRRELKNNYKVTKEKLKEANDADKEKERFLRNITKLINEPLQYVVKGAKRLSDDTTMTQEEQTALVTTNKQHVGRLLDLVNNVLDLSRLEAGMMKYSVRETDVVRLLMTFVSDYNKSNMSDPIRIVCYVDSYTMAIDSTRLCKMMEKLFTIPFNSEETLPSHHRGIRLEKDDETDNLVITVTGSLFADESKLDETERMTNRINKFVMNDFNSGYEITPEFDIVFTLNKSSE